MMRGIFIGAEMNMEDVKEDLRGLPLNFHLIAAESLLECAEARGIVTPGICPPPPFGCGKSPATIYGFCETCFDELFQLFKDI